MPSSRTIVTLTVVSLLLGCSSTLKPGRCDHDSDCAAGQVCNLDATPQGNGRCVAARVVDAGMDSPAPCSACAGTTPICLAGACVECLSNTDCGKDPAKPICDGTTHACGPCTTDDQCVGKLGANPGVCMAHQDGHCATDAEAIYVQNDARSCVSAFGPSGGTAAAPYCSMEPVDLAATGARTLVVVRGTVNAGAWTFQRASGTAEVSIVGQANAFIASAATPALSLSSGAIYVRAVHFSSSAATCITALGGSLRLEGVRVDSCSQGGVLLDGAGFEIRNSVVTNSGPGQLKSTTWGGILVNALAADGTAQLSLVTIEANKWTGLACAGPIIGTGVFASGNMGGDIAPTCNLSACSPAGPNCGASP